MRWIQRFRRGNRRRAAATAVEYALLLGLIGVVLITAVSQTGKAVSDLFQKAANALQGEIDGSGSSGTVPPTQTITGTITVSPSSLTVSEAGCSALSFSNDAAIDAGLALTLTGSGVEGCTPSNACGGNTVPAHGSCNIGYKASSSAPASAALNVIVPGGDSVDIPIHN